LDPEEYENRKKMVAIMASLITDLDAVNNNSRIGAKAVRTNNRLASQAKAEMDEERRKLAEQQRMFVMMRVPLFTWSCLTEYLDFLDLLVDFCDSWINSLIDLSQLFDAGESGKGGKKKKNRRGGGDDEGTEYVAFKYLSLVFECVWILEMMNLSHLYLSFHE
jgi:hypothetical protein